MLVLTRKLGESIHIGRYVTITVASIKCGHVRLAIEAPKDIQVDRREVRERRESAETRH